MSRFVQGQTSNVQFSQQLGMGNFIPHHSNQGTFIPRPRITPLCIPNTEKTYFNPNAHSSIQADHAATRIGQYAHNERSHSPEESYKVRTFFYVKIYVFCLDRNQRVKI